MICNLCGKDMVVTRRWGDGYTEPYERQYQCICGQSVNELEGYGLTWEIDVKNTFENLVSDILDHSFRWTEDELYELEKYQIEKIHKEVTSPEYSE